MAYDNIPTPKPAPSSPSPSTDLQETREALMPVLIKRDPDGIVPHDSPAAKLLSQSGLIVVRQLEMMNVFLGYEQANKYSIQSPDGQILVRRSRTFPKHAEQDPQGYLAEEEASFARAFGRQILRNHRPFRCTVLSPEGDVLFRVSRPFSFINSTIYISLGDDDNNIIGETKQEWHPWRRRYNLFMKRPTGFEQFARIDEPFLSWTFGAVDEEGKLMASVSKEWTGFGRELFTDTSQYVLKFDAVELDATKAAKEASTDANAESKALVPVHHGLTLDQRAILLASAITTDIDYFSRRSGSAGGFMPVMFPMPFPSGGQPEAPASEAGMPVPSDGEPSAAPLSSANELPRSPTADSYWEGQSQDDRLSYPTEPDTSAWSETPLDEGTSLNDPWSQGDASDVWQVDDFDGNGEDFDEGEW